MKTLFIIAFFLFANSSYSQIEFSNYYNFSSKSKSSNSVIQIESGSYYIAGTYDTIIDNINGTSAFVKKIDVNGNELWNKFYSIPSTYGLIFHKIKQLSDNNLLITGSIDYGFGVGPTFVDTYLCKIDTNGTVLWEKNYGAVGTDIGFDFIEHQNGDLTLLSSFGKEINLFVYNSYQLIKTNSIGDTLWTVNYNEDNNLEQFPTSFQETIDLGYVIVGEITNDNATGNGYIIKTDSNGLKIWEKTLDSLINSSIVDVFTNSTSFNIIGNIETSFNDFKPFIENFDLLGTSNWRVILNEQNVHVTAAQKTNDNGYLLACLKTVGSSQLSILIKIDSLGNKLWEKNLNLIDQSTITEICITIDSNIALTGYFYSPSDNAIFITKLKDTLYSTAGIYESDFSLNCSLFPNPTSSLFHLQFEVIQSNTSITITNILGEVVDTYSFSGNDFTLENLNYKPGIYTIVIEDSTHSHTSKKLFFY